MKQKLTRPCVITTVDFNAQTAFKGIGRNALVLVDNSRLNSLVAAAITAVEAGYLERVAVLLLLDSRVADSNEELARFNVGLRALWSAGILVIKPWHGFLSRNEEGYFKTDEIDNIKKECAQALRSANPSFLNEVTKAKTIKAVVNRGETFT